MLRGRPAGAKEASRPECVRQPARDCVRKDAAKAPVSVERAKEEADEMSRRKLHNDALIQKELLKKAQELHQTSQRAINNAVRNKNMHKK